MAVAFDYEAEYEEQYQLFKEDVEYGYLFMNYDIDDAISSFSVEDLYIDMDDYDDMEIEEIHDEIIEELKEYIQDRIEEDYTLLTSDNKWLIEQLEVNGIDTSYYKRQEYGVYLSDEDYSKYTDVYEFYIKNGLLSDMEMEDFSVIMPEYFKDLSVDVEILKDSQFTGGNKSYILEIPNIKVEDDNKYVYLLHYEIQPSYIFLEDNSNKCNASFDYTLGLYKARIEDIDDIDSYDDAEEVLFLATTVELKTNSGADIYKENDFLNENIESKVYDYLKENITHNVEKLNDLIKKMFEIQDIANKELVDIPTKLKDIDNSLEINYKENYVKSDIIAIPHLNDLKMQTLNEKLMNNNNEITTNCVYGGLTYLFFEPNYINVDRNNITVCAGNRYEDIEKRVSNHDGVLSYMEFDGDEVAYYELDKLNNIGVKNEALYLVKDLKENLDHHIKDIATDNICDRIYSHLNEISDILSEKEIEKQKEQEIGL